MSTYSHVLKSGLFNGKAVMIWVITPALLVRTGGFSVAGTRKEEPR